MTPTSKTSIWRGLAPVSTGETQLSLSTTSKGEFKTLVSTGADPTKNAAAIEREALQFLPRPAKRGC